MHNGTSLFATFILAMVLLLQLQSTCDAAATKPPQKTVQISEPSAPAGEAEAISQEHRKSVMKALNVPKESVPASPKGSEAAAPVDTKLPAPPESESAVMPEEDVQIEQSRPAPDMEFPGQAVVYVLVGITSSAILLLVLRVYRLRLSRAERKYGVHGDRANQELTPLPMAIEDVNSDEEDHTLFELVQV
ncbi:uncharacterized protein Dana_GF11234, isoform A [Drosophila ananassae]|uniref:Uncharacterized protein, isoform A n=1 Tax=Drosophila ananassae TaxID=7217 RepID=B3MGA2_DROAN|nr:uncharacterized protein LOC6494098 isoform X2 [Drosophila ananassae]EDV37805.2 uncharacterized protein Dana_GF11234, isoform A [Drosophila ananassae]